MSTASEHNCFINILSLTQSDQGKITIENSLFFNNNGDGLLNINNKGTVVINECSFLSNTMADSALNIITTGILPASVFVTNCVFQENTNRRTGSFGSAVIVHSYSLDITIYKVTFTQNEAWSATSLMILIPGTAQEPEIFTHFPSQKPSTVSHSTSNTVLNRTPTRSTTRRSSIVSTTTPYTALNRGLTRETYTQSSLSPYRDRPIGNIFLNVSFTTFDSNSAQNSAAGVLILSYGEGYATVNMHSVTFLRNQASSGSALSIIGNEIHASLTMVSCNLTGNFHPALSSLLFG